MAKTPAEVMQLAKEAGVKFVDFRFVDLFGAWQHTTKSISDVDEDIFEDGVGFDGSSIRGFQAINESDMLLIPDPDTAVLDPFTAYPTLNLVGDVFHPLTREPYAKDPRGLAKRAEAFLQASGVGDTAYFGPEPEFFIFDNVRYDSNNYSSFHEVDSVEGFWNTGTDEGPNLGNKIRPKGGYFPVAPHDTLVDIRAEIVLILEELGIPVEVHHHEVGTAGQCEIDMRFNTLVAIADSVLQYKYVVKNVAKKHGKVATFMPKPIFADNGSGMHVHQSIWKDGKNTFFNPENYAGLSDTARHYVGGILKHGGAILAFGAPTVNSYRRLVPGFEAPVNLVYSQANRSAAVRVPIYSTSERSKRIEFRCPDTAANPYLTFSALLLAGLDGVKNKIEPGDPAEFDLFEASKEELAKIKTTPGSLPEALAALEADHDFLLQGGVFCQDLIDTWIDWKRTNELTPINFRPTPYEFYLYFDV
jgi:glutamine synthetase